MDLLLCLRRAYRSKAVQSGINEVTASGDLGGKPAIIIHGRGDNLIHVNHSSRPYLALNHLREGQRSRLRYYEVTRAQHFDALLRFADVSRHYIPLHYYFERAMDVMWSHLKKGRALPPSQVIYTEPGSHAAAPDLPPISRAPQRTAIRIEKSGIYIP